MKSELINIRPDARVKSNGCSGTLEREEWRPIKGYEGLYEVSSFGRVKSLGRVCKRRDGNVSNIAPKILSPANENGYYRVVLYSISGKTKHYLVQRLVMSAFVPNPDNLPCVNHRNEVKTANYPDNMEWCDHKYNTNYGTCIPRRAAKIKGIKRSTETILKKIQSAKGQMTPVLQFSLNNQFIKEWESQRSAARELGIRQAGISGCCLGKYKQSGGYIWKYKSNYENEQRQ